MPLADLRLVEDALRGKKSQFIYRRMNGRYFVSRRPDRAKQTPAQQATRLRFRSASAQAKVVLADPALRAPYEKCARAKRRPLRQFVIAEFLRRESQAAAEANVPAAQAKTCR